MGIVRLLLALAVCHSHFPIMDVEVVDGHEAVLAFFVISGFYMALILDTAYPSAKNFYVGRFLSLYPIYVFALIVSLGLLVVFNIHPMSSIGHMEELMSDPGAALTMLWTSTCVIGQEFLFSIGFTSGHGLHFVEAGRDGLWRNAPLIQAWSLSLETVFYAMAPFVVALRTRTLAALFSTSLLLKVGIILMGLGDVVLFKRLFLLEFWLFIGGILTYRAYKQLPEAPRKTDYFLMCALVVSLIFVGDIPENIQPFALPLLTMATMPFIFRGFSRFSFDIFLGRISYPFYLLHFSIIAVFEEYAEEPWGWGIVIMSLTAAIFTHYLFAPAIEPLKKRLRKTSALPASAPALKRDIS